MADPAWVATMTKAKVPEAVQTKLVDMGYSSRASFSFATEEVFKAFMKHALVSAAVIGGVSAECWEFHPLVGMLRSLWKDCQPPASDSHAPPRPTMALALPSTVASAATGAAGGARLSVADRDRLRRDLEAKYPSVLLTPSSLPAMSYLQLVQPQVSQKAWEWVLWKKMLSEKAANAVRERKADKERDAIAEYLMAASGVQAEQWDLDLSPSPFKVQGLLYVRAHAFAMCGACHLGSWSLYISKFLEFYTADVGEHFRPPTVQEAEEADKAAMQEVFTLCFAGSSLDDALSNIAVDRDLLRHFLVPRPKLPKAASQPFAPRPSKEGRSGREPLKRKAEFTKRFNKRPRTGECWDWIDGECQNADCPFKHYCTKCGSSRHNSTKCTGPKQR